MHTDGTVIFAGVGFVLAPVLNINQRSSLNFQNALLEAGVEFTSARATEQPSPSIVIERTPPNHLNVTVRLVGQPNLGNLVVVSENAQGLSTSAFQEEAEAVGSAFDAVWKPQNRQVLSRDVTVRTLFESSRPDAFGEIWESVLGRKLDALRVLGNEVKGGGLRLVIPPLSSDPNPHQIEIKIESFLRDPQKIYVEAQFLWPQPMPANTSLDSRQLLQDTDSYIDGQITRFIMEAQT